MMTAMDDAITSGRAAIQATLLRDACTITHTPTTQSARGGQTHGTPTTIATVANVQRTLNAVETQAAERLGVISPAVIRLPIDTVVTSADVITVGTQSFAVVTPLENTIDLTLKILCKEV